LNLHFRTSIIALNHAESQLVLNLPTKFSGILRTTEAGGYVCQEYITGSGHYCRFMGSSGWNNWVL